MYDLIKLDLWRFFYRENAILVNKVFISHERYIKIFWINEDKNTIILYLSVKLHYIKNALFVKNRNLVA